MKVNQLIPKATLGCALVGAVSLSIVGVAAAVDAVSRPAPEAIPTTQAVTFTIPQQTHFTPASPLNITLGTFGGTGTRAYVVNFAGTIAPHSVDGLEEHVNCELRIGTRIIGKAFHAASGGALPSSSYIYQSMAITGTFNATAGQKLKLACTTLNTSDVIMENGHVVTQMVASQSGGV